MATANSRSRPKSRSAKGGATSSRSNASSRGQTRTRSAASNRSRGTAAPSARASSNGAVGTVRKVAGPALAVGAVAAGVAGGIALKGRTQRPKVLGLKVPRSISKPSLGDVDMKSMAKNLGKASKQFGQASKSLSRDIERVGEQAERIGKMLD